MMMEEEKDDNGNENPNKQTMLSAVIDGLSVTRTSRDVGTRSAI